MTNEKYRAVLGLHPTVAGMGWVLAAEPLSLVDWGVVYPGTDKNAAALKRAQKLIETFSPATIVMRSPAAASRMRVKRIRSLIASIKQIARRQNIEFKIYPGAEVKTHFSRFGVTTRHEIASLLVANFPELASRLPPKRRPWLPEDSRLGLFDAVALVVAFAIERDLIDKPLRKPDTA